MVPRSRTALVAATKSFAKEDLGRTWREFLGTCALQLAALATVLLASSAPIKLLGAIGIGLLHMRLFIFMHDAAHGSIFRTSRLGRNLARLVGLTVFVSPRAWDDIHGHHHRTIGKPFEGDIAAATDADLADRALSVAQWLALDEQTRTRYRMVRHPLIVFGAFFGAFLIGHCFGPFAKNPRRYWQGPLAFCAWLVTCVLIARYASALDAFLLLAFPQLLAAAIGGYIFYAQHNFPQARVAAADAWHPIDAATEAASYFAMGPVMSWLTGNIGYHHVHHVNPRIPFYRLPEAMAAVPELQNPPTTTWALKDVALCLRSSLWDPETQGLISFAEADRRAA